MNFSSCDHYLGKIFLHLSGAIGLSALSAKYLDIGSALRKFFSPLIQFLINFFIAMILVYGVYSTERGSLLKYLLFVALAIWIGQTVKPYIENLEANNSLIKVFLLTLGVFLGMMAIGYSDKKNLLGLGPYLFAGLIGLIIMQIVVYFLVPSLQNNEVNIFMQLFGVALFSVFTAYDVQVLRKNEMICQNALRNSRASADYPAESLGLYFDFVNLFRNLDI
jgi:FtsH-binding integral membrane protein